MSATPWIDADLGFVSDHPELASKEIGVALGRSQWSIAHIRRKLSSGWSPERNRWSVEEDDVIRQAPHSMTARQIAALLPSRTPVAVRSRRRILGIDASEIRGEASPFEPGKRTIIAKTCARCGLVFPGSRFSPVTRGEGAYTSAACKKCLAESAARWASSNPSVIAARNGRAKPRKRVRHAELQNLTALTADRRGEPYTEADYEVLRDPSLSMLGKALRLHRTYAAVSSECFRSGISTAREVSEIEAWLIENPNASRVEEITAALKQEFSAAGVQFPEWDWDDDDLKESA